MSTHTGLAEPRRAARAIPLAISLGSARVVVLAVVCVLLWQAFAPTSFGGRTSYVITDGTSMLPNFRADGLVITRTRKTYKVGDVVAYHNADLNAVVMHRIVAEGAAHYTFKGDNNDFRDRYQPTRADIVGMEWVYLPGAGRYVRLLRDPAAFGLILAGITAMSLLGTRRSRRRRRHHAW